jgi:hypothetical protein
VTLDSAFDDEEEPLLFLEEEWLELTDVRDVLVAEVRLVSLPGSDNDPFDGERLAGLGSREELLKLPLS